MLSNKLQHWGAGRFYIYVLQNTKDKFVHPYTKKFGDKLSIFRLNNFRPQSGRAVARFIDCREIMTTVRNNSTVFKGIAQHELLFSLN